MAASAVTTRSSGKRKPIPPSPSVDDEGWRVGLSGPAFPAFPACRPSLFRGPVGVGEIGGRLALRPECVQGLGGGHRSWLPPGPASLPALSSELLPPPFGTSSVYWSPSVEPGGTVVARARSRRRQDARPPPRRRSRLAFSLCKELPACTSLAYRGIGASLRNRIEAGLAALRENPANLGIWLGIGCPDRLPVAQGGRIRSDSPRRGRHSRLVGAAGRGCGRGAVDRTHRDPDAGGPGDLPRPGRLDRAGARLDAKRRAHR